MKKYSFTLLIGVIILILFTNISKPNSGLNNDELFDLIEKENKNIENYLQVENISINKSSFDPKEDIKIPKESFLKGFINNLIGKKEEEKTPIKTSEKIIDRYKEYTRNTVFYNNDIPETIFSDSTFTTRDGTIKDIILYDKGSAKISANNIVSEEENKVIEYNDWKEYNNKVDMMDYKKLTGIIRKISNFVEVNEVDENNIYKEEFESIDNDNIKSIMKDLKIDQIIDNSNIIKYDELFSKNWDREHVLINFSVPLRDLHINKFIFAITVSEEDIKYNIRIELSLEQFNIMNDLNLPKELQ
ncbi:hypothetical protein [Miniphocaeibacter halophilus]|uniref:Uncharacterized protein n=1 Tax=Miniphocaeibacter halophilus TaxID=2931922 RepID=A0AC61MUQ1_9FIRM|nr:hypothetical protein [Miniphocaeibacter halophilus]QQK07043.1 hypothetical protein JFY71_06750 [Miniphocaeibacter halophilus]